MWSKPPFYRITFARQVFRRFAVVIVVVKVLIAAYKYLL